MMTAIVGARVFDGHEIAPADCVVIESGVVRSVGSEVPTECIRVDGSGMTLLPGLIDAHTHTLEDHLREALKFGVTTELEMAGQWSAERLEAVAEDDSSADVRTAQNAVTAPGGHPNQLLKHLFDLQNPAQAEAEKKAAAEAGVNRSSANFLGVSTPEEARSFVRKQIDNGAHYIKVMIEEGTVLAEPGLPVIADDVLAAAIDEAKRHGKMVIAHALTEATTLKALSMGVDGLAHLFIDKAHSEEVIEAFVSTGAFIIPCLTLNSSLIGRRGEPFARDRRVGPKLTPAWHGALCSCFNTFPQGSMADILATVGALHRAGVEILAGSDVSAPLVEWGGLAHGASLHHDLQLLVQAGLTPVEALRSATSLPTQRFSLDDRGRIAPGLRADILMVEGDPTTDISSTLSIARVWRRGVEADRSKVAVQHAA
jgi:imidazolonepropionase-like amidohydrolase